MSLFCIALDNKGRDMFLAEAPTQEEAVAELGKEIREGGTPNQNRYVGGTVAHSVGGYIVLRTDDPIDKATWELRRKES